MGCANFPLLLYRNNGIVFRCLLGSPRQKQKNAAHRLSVWIRDRVKLYTMTKRDRFEQKKEKTSEKIPEVQSLKYIY